MDGSRHQQLQCAECFVRKASHTRVWFQNQLHMGKSDRYEFRGSGALGWKRAAGYLQSIQSQAESWGRILQPCSSVEREFQLSIGIWSRLKRSCEQAYRRVAMEWNCLMAGWVPLHPSGRLQYFRHGRRPSIPHAQLESELPWSGEFGKTGPVVRSQGVRAADPGDFRQCGPRFAAWSGFVLARHVVLQEVEDQ